MDDLSCPIFITHISQSLHGRHNITAAKNAGAQTDRRQLVVAKTVAPKITQPGFWRGKQMAPRLLRGLKFFSAPAPHLHTSNPQPAPHFFSLKPSPAYPKSTKNS